MKNRKLCDHLLWTLFIYQKKRRFSKKKFTKTLKTKNKLKLLRLKLNLLPYFLSFRLDNINKPNEYSLSPSFRHPHPLKHRRHHTRLRRMHRNTHSGRLLRPNRRTLPRQPNSPSQLHFLLKCYYRFSNDNQFRLRFFLQRIQFLWNSSNLLRRKRNNVQFNWTCSIYNILPQSYIQHSNGRSKHLRLV